MNAIQRARWRFARLALRLSFESIAFAIVIGVILIAYAVLE